MGRRNAVWQAPVAKCGDCGFAICFDCCVECCGDSFCGQRYDCHLTTSCVRKRVECLMLSLYTVYGKAVFSHSASSRVICRNRVRLCKYSALATLLWYSHFQYSTSAKSMDLISSFKLLILSLITFREYSRSTGLCSHEGA